MGSDDDCSPLCEGARRRSAAQWHCKHRGMGTNMSIFWGGMYPAAVLGCTVHPGGWDFYVDTTVDYTRRRGVTSFPSSDCDPYQDQLFADSNGCKDKTNEDLLPPRTSLETQFEEWARWFDEHIEMATELSDYVCPSGYAAVNKNLDGTSKEFSTNALSQAQDCADICNGRFGCTGFEYGNDEGGPLKCATYTGGESDYWNDEVLLEDAAWHSCMKQNWWEYWYSLRKEYTWSSGAA